MIIIFAFLFTIVGIWNIWRPDVTREISWSFKELFGYRPIKDNFFNSKVAFRITGILHLIIGILFFIISFDIYIKGRL
jgi:uncharacterized membrane protein